MAGESHQVMKNITRVKDWKKRVDGYYVRLQWKGQSYSKLFPIKLHGSETAALDRAIEWRDDTEEQIGKPRSDRLVMGSTRPTNTGEKGIRRQMVQYWRKGKPIGTPKDCYIVTTFDEHGKLHRTSVSIEKHGEQKALEMARQQYKERCKY